MGLARRGGNTIPLCRVYQLTVKFLADCCARGTAFAEARFMLYWLGERDLVVGQQCPAARANWTPYGSALLCGEFVKGRCGSVRGFYATQSSKGAALSKG